MIPRAVAGDENEAGRLIAQEYLFARSGIFLIYMHLSYDKADTLSILRNGIYLIPDGKLVEILEDPRTPPSVIEVTRENGVPRSAWTRAFAKPGDVGERRGHAHRAACVDADLLHWSLDLERRNDKLCREYRRDRSGKSRRGRCGENGLALRLGVACINPGRGFPRLGKEAHDYIGRPDEDKEDADRSSRRPKRRETPLDEDSRLSAR